MVKKKAKRKLKKIAFRRDVGPKTTILRRLALRKKYEKKYLVSAVDKDMLKEAKKEFQRWNREKKKAGKAGRNRAFFKIISSYSHYDYDPQYGEKVIRRRFDPVKERKRTGIARRLLRGLKMMEQAGR